MTVVDDLAEALATDLSGSFERLVDTYQHRLFGFALRLSGDPREAEEIAQDTFIRCYRALRDYPPERVRSLVLRPWLYQITLNLARNRQRRRQLPVTSLTPDASLPPLDPPASPDTDPAAQALVREHRDSLARCLAALPLRYRAAVVLRHVDGLAYSEVATTLGVPVGTAKANVHRGSKLLRAALAVADVAPSTAHTPVKSVSVPGQTEPHPSAL